MTFGLFIDPGAHELACACSIDEQLVAAHMAPREHFAVGNTVTGIDVLVIERMRVYPGPSRGNDPNDLIDVTDAGAYVEGAIAARGGPKRATAKPYAADWKGQVKKPVHHMRVWSVLTPAERAILAKACGYTEEQIEAKIDAACQALARTGKVVKYAWNAHNLFDAVGLLLWFTKRLGKGGHRFLRAQ